MSRFTQLLLLVAVVLSLSLHAPPARAAAKDAAALKLGSDAINNDYLATNFDAAEKKLKQAIALCGAKNCTGKTRGQLHRDLGVIYVAGMKKNDEGKAQFVEAIKADPNVALDKDLATPEMQTAFAAAKGSASAPAAAGESPAPTAAVATGDIVHTPLAAQAILTPVPIYAEVAANASAAKVQARYKPFGATEWKTLDLHKLDNGYGAEIPCLDVGSTTGDLEYFIQAIDGNGDVVAISGSKNAPHKVSIQAQLSGEAPHLPGKPAPAACADPSSCPPGLPGCPSKGGRKFGDKGQGTGCESDDECQESLSCRTGTCEADKGATAKACESSNDCENGDKCSGGFCEGAGAGYAQNWVTLGIQQDVLYMSGKNVCSGDEFNCFYSGDTSYAPTNIVGGNNIAGGFASATTRVLAGYDRALSKNITLGGRLGFAFGGSPKVQDKSFLPVHVEARAAYWFGKDALAKVGLRPYVVLSGGVAQADAKLTVKVTDRFKDDNQTDATDHELKINAWRKTGTEFVALGGGAMYAINPKSGIVAELKLMQLFPASGTAISGQLGYSLGF